MSDSHATPDAHGPAGHVADVHGASHEVAGVHGSVADHGDGHGHDDHAHGGETLGPIGWPMWGMGVVGVVAALIVVACFVVSTGFVFFDRLVPA